MKTTRISIALVCVIILSMSVSSVQAAEYHSLNNRHFIGITAGMWNQLTGTRTEIGVSGVTTEVGTGGAMGGVTYSHWFKENMSLHISLRGLATDVETRIGAGGVSVVNTHVASILFGLKYYFLQSTDGSALRPYAEVAIGPFIGSQSETSVGTVVAIESRDKVAAGGQLGGGLDIIISRHFLASVGVGLNLMSDFSRPVGGSKNYSGPEFSFSFGYLFGSGR